MNIIVTGADGQLGSEINRFKDGFKDIRFHFTDIKTLDLTNKKDVEKYISDISADILINCAAYTAVDNAEKDTENAHAVNAVVPETLAKLSSELGFNLIHISTDYVFEGNQHSPINETEPTAPKSVYGKTKLLGEKYVNKHSNAIILRTSWLYSGFGNNFVKSMLRLGKEKNELGVVFDQIGSPTNAADLAKSILQIIDQYQKNNSWKSGIYHYSNEGVCSWYDFAITIMELANLNCKVRPILSHEYPVPAPRPYYSVLNKQKIKETFNLKIPYWKQSLKNTITELLD